MDATNELKQAALSLSRDEFASNYDHPFLAVRMTAEEEDEDAGFRTVVASSVEELQIYSAVLAVRKRPGANSFSFITIGRTANNDIVIEVTSVSKVHAMIQASGNDYTLSDAGSKNGTTLNGEPVGRNANARLTSGDEIRLSPQVLATFMDAHEAHDWLRNWR